jgi:hypothetical protein
MQITLRDCFWATIVIGLTIGLVIERRDVLALRGAQEEAESWKKSAEVLRTLVEKHGFEVSLDEFHLHVTDPSGVVVLKAGQNCCVFRAASFPTGHFELDWFLIIGTPLLVLVALFLFVFRRSIAERMAMPTPQFKPYRSYVIGCINVWGLIFFTVMAIISYQSRNPFTGALHFAFAVMQAHSLKQFGFRWQTPERVAKFNASFVKPFPWTDLFKLD